MPKIVYKTTTPPKPKTKPIRIRYRDPSGKRHEGLFVWSDTENTWVEVNKGPDGIGLYIEGGWKIIGWRRHY